MVLNWLLSGYGDVTVPKHGFENHDWRSQQGDVGRSGKTWEDLCNGPDPPETRAIL